MVVSRQPSNQATSLAPGHTGQQLHVSGVFIVLLELALVVENLLPILVVVVWLPARARGVGDRLVATFSVTCILSALVPTPLGLASYFSGGWYGGAPTCTTYQVTSIWCNLSSLALLTSMCVNCTFAVWRLRKITPAAQCHSCNRSGLKALPVLEHCAFTGTSTIAPCSSLHSSQLPTSTQTTTVFSSRHASPSKQQQQQHAHLNAIPKQTAKQPSSVTTTMNSLAVEDKDSNEALDSSDTDSEFVLKQHVNTVPTETEIKNKHASRDPRVETKSNTRKGENIKRLGNERHIHLDDDCPPFSKHCNHSPPVEQSSISRGHTEFESFRFSSLNNKMCIPQQESPNSVHASNNKQRIDDTSQNGPVSMCNKITLCADNCENAVRPEEGISTHTRDGFISRSRQTRDYVSLMMFLLFTCTLAISSLPVIGFGPRSTHSEKACRSWLVPVPVTGKEKTFYVAFILFVYVCLVVGCSSGISVCLQVSKRMKHERRRKLRLYHEEENVPDMGELSVLDDLKRQYSLTCVAMAGLLTWLPIAVMLTLQKSGVQVSEATLMYSNIATSLPGLLNPLLYSLAMAKYRTGYKAIMAKCCCNKKHKSQRLRVAHNQANMADDEASTDTAMDTSATGHTCIHGRANPNHDHLSDVNADIHDDDIDDDDDFLDESEQYEGEVNIPSSKLSEKTPLQAILVSLPPAGALRTMLANRVKSPWQRQHGAFSSSSNDHDCLLVSGADFVDEETGL